MKGEKITTITSRTGSKLVFTENGDNSYYDYFPSTKYRNKVNEIKHKRSYKREQTKAALNRTISNFDIHSFSHLAHFREVAANKTIDSIWNYAAGPVVVAKREQFAELRTDFRKEARLKIEKLFERP